MSLLRFYLVLALTVPALAFTISLLHNWYTSDSAPAVQLDHILAQAFTTTPAHNMRCIMSAQDECTDAIFIQLSADHWQHSNANPQQHYFEFAESASQRLLCQRQPDASLYCLRLQLADATSVNTKQRFSLLFYAALFIVFFIYAATLFKDAAVLRASALDEIRHGKLPAFRLSPKSYLAPLAKSLQNMTARISELTTFQTEIAETICHDIKTPVARMRFIAHQIENKGDSATAKQLTSNLKEIEENVNEYLLLAQNQYLAEALSYDAIKLEEFLLQLKQLFSLDNQITIDITIAKHVIVLANRRLLHRALANLISNAMRYAVAKIAIVVTMADGYCHISVHDDGQAAATKATAPRATETLHHSLGLSIVRRVCQQHSGHFNFTTSPLGGHTATLSLPQHK
ncbi:HAMP domain-containing histidine kinase [Rheinheimera sp. MA13]|uniref:histidine kinase n=1 Tax=Rheinheimera maricola TaxID=2793282 RepID=A0ABS7X9H8_9GAMM|nr:HAMP domain-containing sensor histidine kinase [Rheinheimera maricola]MBZ9611457.1 HAMP domain-containing histidine kinase [Rheinheimera maricola]